MPAGTAASGGSELKILLFSAVAECTSVSLLELTSEEREVRGRERSIELPYPPVSHLIWDAISVNQWI